MLGELRVVNVPIGDGRALLRARCAQRQLAAADTRVRQDSLEQVKGIGIEVRGIVLERHRQHRIDTESELDGDLGDEQVRTRRHARNDPQL